MKKNKKEQKQKEPKQFIVYRKGYNMFNAQEYIVREELTKQELEKYLTEHINSIGDIEVFNINSKVKIETDIKFKLDVLEI